ncbi:MAG: DinB family protein [Chloroflexi bacterium]|nr:DinB family protein [Chloroflexota bacterium]
MPRLKITSAEIQKHLSLLAETPRRIAASTTGLAELRLKTSPGDKKWSVVELLAHLRACDDLWSHSIYAMLTQDSPMLPLLDERRWAKTTRYASLEFQQSFQAFALKRGELLRVLADLPEAVWARTASIEGRTHSVFSQARRMALHEHEHCQQIEALCK